MHKPSLALAAVLVTAAAGIHARDASGTAQAFVNARILPVTGPPIEKGTLVVDGGKIVAVGASSDVKIPAGAATIDLTGKTLMPGLVDSHSHIGSPGRRRWLARRFSRMSACSTPSTCVRSSIRARAGGRHHDRNIMPGSGHLLSGQTVYLKLRRGNDDRRPPDPAAGRPDCRRPEDGQRHELDSSRRLGPVSRHARQVRGPRARAVHQGAANIATRSARPAATPAKMPTRDLAMEALVEVLDGKRTVHFHTHRHDDIVTVLRLSQEFGFKPVLHHVSEGWKVADEIAKAGVAASLICHRLARAASSRRWMSRSRRRRCSTRQACSSGSTPTTRSPTRASFFAPPAWRCGPGMSRDKALYGMTMAGARMLGLDVAHRLARGGQRRRFRGALRRSPQCLHARRTDLGGREEGVRPRRCPRITLFAVGGYGAGRGVLLHLDDEADEDAEARQ